MRANRDLDAALADAEARYVAANPKSEARHREAKAWMPGGNTRTILHYDPFPVGIERGEGARLLDIDGHEYLDLLGEYSAGFYGHSPAPVVAALREALEGGLVLGGPNRYEASLAEAFCARFPSVDLVRFCNSGTEANLLAVQMARALTGRSRFIVLEGGYHGGVFYYMPGYGAMNLDLPVLPVPLNDVEALLTTARQAGDDLAGILLEPLMGAGGCLAADSAFLAAARQAADETGAILIFDEVMTSRLDYGGLQAAMGVTPDLTSFGKYLGGGLSFGAVGGRRDLMARFDPEHPQPLPHSGTFNNNVMMMAAALAGITQVLTKEAIAHCNAMGDRLRARLEAIAEEAGVPLQITGRGSMLGVHFQNERPSSVRDARPHFAWQKLMQLELLNRGLYTARRGLCALTMPMTEADVGEAAEIYKEVLMAYRVLGQEVLVN